MSRRIVIAILMLTAALVPLSVGAADMQGKVQSVNTDQRTFTLESSITIWLAEGVAIDSVKAGDEVTVSAEERDGKPIATSITIK
jgi:hypothetical protein